jgi:hypothetical protein
MVRKGGLFWSHSAPSVWCPPGVLGEHSEGSSSGHGKSVCNPREILSHMNGFAEVTGQDHPLPRHGPTGFVQTH